MRASALSVWVFINILCFSMCAYLYLIWSQYWMQIGRRRIFDKPTTDNQKSSTIYQDTFLPVKKDFLSELSSAVKYRRSAVGAYRRDKKLIQSASESAPSNVVVKTHGSPRFPNVHKPVLELDSESYVCSDMTTSDCEKKTTEFKELLLKEFHRVLMSDGNVFKSGLESQNTYNVQYSGPGARQELPGHDVLCLLKNVSVRTISATDEPFKRKRYKIPVFNLNKTKFKTCAVVTSAGALLGSRLGEFIDSHDMVLRFNNAPTDDYAEDVGSKTTIRILNSQVVAKSEFRFLQDPMFMNKTILIWDPANYSSTLQQWFRQPDFLFFPVYKQYLEQHRNADAHLIHPNVLWDLWTVLQNSSPYRLRRNPPSSGFIGLWVSLHICDRVRMFEYVPSVRATRRCHYYVARNDTGCTLGAWHPLAQEKSLAERIRDNRDLDVFQRGFIDVPGFRNVGCDR